MADKISLLRQCNQKLNTMCVVAALTGVNIMATVINMVMHRWWLGVACAVVSLVLFFLCVALKKAMLIVNVLILFATEEINDD